MNDIPPAGRDNGEIKGPQPVRLLLGESQPVANAKNADAFSASGLASINGLASIKVSNDSADETPGGPTEK